jgi:Fe-S-cluster containining protein
MTHLFEGVVLADYIRRNELNDVLEKFRQHTEIQNDILERHHVGRNDGLGQHYDTLRVTKYANEWIRKGIPCPFQDSEGACSIHPIKPTACSTCLVVTPPWRCNEPGENGPVHVDCREPNRFSSKLDSAFIKEVFELKENIVVVPMLMGKAILAGMKLLEEGVTALKQYIRDFKEEDKPNGTLDNGGDPPEHRHRRGDRLAREHALPRDVADGEVVG